MLSFKLAIRNIKKGMKSFGPFLIACVTMFVMLFVAAAISLSPSVNKLPYGGDIVAQLMYFAIIILTIFGLMILVYSYRFLQLQRSREFGLYNILGFNKGNIAMVSLFELMISYIITVFVGSIIGIAFSKFSFLIFVRLIGGNYFNLEINFNAILMVSGIFLIFFLILMMIGTFIIWRSSSLDLLREESKGEKEPKGNFFFALIAVLLLGIGYYIAITVKNPISAFTNFFLAVLLVIFGTYFFYISFTVWFLKQKKKRNSYYQPHNFITTSSMLYRMKANAVGLGNITILLSMAIVTMVVTVGLYFGTAQMIRNVYPSEAQISYYNHFYTPKEETSESPVRISRQGLEQKVEKIASDAHVKVSNLKSILSATGLSAELNGSNKNQIKIRESSNYYSSDIYFLNFITVDSLNALGATQLPRLSKNEIALYTPEKNLKTAQVVNLEGTTYPVKGLVKDIPPIPNYVHTKQEVFLIFADEDSLDQAVEQYNTAIKKKDNSVSILSSTEVMFSIKPEDENKFKKGLGENSNFDLSFRSEQMKSQKAQIGGFVFIGFILGISFILGAALIIYYKQLSEGRQDKRSFKILQEVGFSKGEVQKTIKSQVRILFFLPIVVSIVHFGFAYIMISKILELFGITDVTIVAMVSIITILIVSLLYYLIYKITSRVYYKIVER
ncbi:FtsX-like permease family protein [Lactococcus fujiensis]|nr:FtsX-like permease family protein [Lactococcus fujiensis]